MLRWRALGLAIGISLVSAACGGSAADITSDTSDTSDSSLPTPSTPASAETSRATPEVSPAATDDGGRSNDSSTTTAPVPTSIAPADPDPSGGEAGEAVDADDPIGSDSNTSADRVLAEQARLRATDLPGWSAQGASDWSAPGRDTSVPAGCEHIRVAAAVPTTASVDSSTFVASDGLKELFNSISVYRDGTTAQSMLAALDHDNTPDCFERILVGQSGTISVDRATVTRVRLSRADGGVAYVAALTVTVGGRPYDFLARFAYARQGRAVSFMMAFGYESLPAESEPAFDAVLRRLP